MNYLFLLFFSVSSWAVGVEFDIPMFSKKVVNQGTEVSQDSRCVGSEDPGTGQKTFSCGTSRKSAEEAQRQQEANLERHSSEYAKEQLRAARRQP